MQFIIRSSIVSAFCLVISACGSMTLHTAPLPVVDGTSIPELITQSQTIQANYAKQIEKASDALQDNARFNFGNGTALAAASIFHGNRNVLGFFGLSGGAGLAADSIFNPALQIDAYEAGHGAIACMITKAQAVAQSEVILLAAEQNNLVNSTGGEFFNVWPLQSTQLNKSAKPLLASTAAIRNMALLEAQKNVTTFQAARKVDLVNVLRINVLQVDHATRQKLRAALKTQQPKGLRDGLIADAAEARKVKDDAKASGIALTALSRVPDANKTSADLLAKTFEAAANVTAFDTDLRTCAASSGL
ncbi:hypothetical protein [Polaromonas sp. YR568]|uniref:hypothetical protein n=1 Tax=Polaromonas sp. YR568 TaxID=1855301 RepID=UPI00398C0C59